MRAAVGLAHALLVRAVFVLAWFFLAAFLLSSSPSGITARTTAPVPFTAILPVCTTVVAAKSTADATTQPCNVQQIAASRGSLKMGLGNMGYPIKKGGL